MVVLSDQWPIFLYSDGVYDPENAWNGLLRGHLLINVSRRLSEFVPLYLQAT